MTTDVLTETQRNVLHFIRHYIKTVGYPPSIREIARGVKLSSSSSVFHHLRILESFGYISRAPDIPRGLVVLAPEDGDD